VLKGQQEPWVRWLVFAGGLVLGAVVLAFSQYGRDFWKFVLDSRVELYKVFWPTRAETLQTTLVVFVFVTIAALFFWVLDIMLAWATRALTGQGG
jgi:preprotein translocase subunit SecE